MEQLNDFDRQFLKRNAQLIRSVGYKRAADNAIGAVKRFRQEFGKCYQDEGVAKDIFNEIEICLDALSKLDSNPKAKRIKEKPNE